MKVKFLASGQYATPHSDESQFSYAAGEVLDLSTVTRSPAWLAERLVKLGRAERVVAELEAAPETKPAELEAVETKPATGELETKPARRRKQRDRLLD